MCCNGLISFIALVMGVMAIVYVVYQFYSFIRCGCGKYGPFVSSYGKIKDDMLDEVRCVLKKSKKKLRVTDLGCGSGALLLPLAKEFPQHEFVGVEWDIVPLTMGKLKARGLKNISFVKENYMTSDYSDFDVIMCYVLKVTGEPLGKKLAKEIKDSAVVISEMFPLGHLEEVKQIKSSIYGVSENIFVYKKPVGKKAEAKKAEVKKVAAKKEVAPKKAEAKKVEAKKAEVKKVVAKKEVAPKKAEAKKVETKKAEVKKVAAKKEVAPQKAEAKKVEAKKAEVKKVVAKKEVAPKKAGAKTKATATKTKKK